MRDDLRQVAPRRRFAAREMDMQNAEACCLAKHAFPNISAKFALPRDKSERVRTISAAKRAAGRQFGKEPGRPFNFLRSCGHKAPSASLRVPRAAPRHLSRP